MNARVSATRRKNRLAGGSFEIPPEVKWFTNITNANTRRAYQAAIHDFMSFTGIARPEQFRSVTRFHVNAWRDDLIARPLGGATVRHRLAALSALYEYLCDCNAVAHNPVKSVKRPPVEMRAGKTPALDEGQARSLLNAPVSATVKDMRDRALLATLLYHALRRDELCRLMVNAYRHQRRGVPHLKVSGKGGKTRYLPLHPMAGELIDKYLEAAGHVDDEAGALFRPLHNARDPLSPKALTPDAVYKIVRGYAVKLGLNIGAHALRATAAANALNHQADIARVQEWLGHANIATTRIYDRRSTKLEDSPTFKVAY